MPKFASNLSVAVTCALGCTASHEGDSGSARALGTVTCEAEGGAYPIDSYAPHLTKVGHMGALSFELVQSNPAPPGQGDNTFTVKITRSDNTPFGGKLYVDPYKGVFMPLHGHAASVVPTITFDPTRNTYTLIPMDLFMPGLWRVTLEAFDTTGTDADAARSPTDVAVFYFCVG
ncbi:MAG: FixH family protein [Myxococcota bacterium]|nr:FixH family protein [Myxococcota bacterium]